MPKACTAYWISAGSVRVTLVSNCPLVEVATPAGKRDSEKTPPLTLYFSHLNAGPNGLHKRMHLQVHTHKNAQTIPLFNI